ncbi:ABC transporter permease [Paenibacillus protaetiae]|uniref:ABC transporter permease n=1 Tax=Paenibacillus protaetiae TaxID=2509456 RepID=A0A4P6EVC7_9BACL|nr:ABC transporter permease [Paenibacillus protaetiae]QAY67250.1 hypothetical protein ET464_13425 [Paenibacillus protaetiae]
MRFGNMLRSEWLKLSRSFIWLLVPVSPLVAAIVGVLTRMDEVKSGDELGVLLSAMSSFHATLLLPILTGIFSAFVCRYEHGSGGWKQLLSLPVSRTGLYTAKFTIVALLLAAVQLLFIAAVLLAAAYQGITGQLTPLKLISSIGGSWLACLPLAALQLWVSTGWSSFAAPLVINVMLTLPNMLVINSASIAPYYPWAQPALAMMSAGTLTYGMPVTGLPLTNLLITVLGSFVLFAAAGLIYFNRKEL